jgi:septal ring factor EnvC (AmiA/AmiB activator)
LKSSSSSVSWPPRRPSTLAGLALLGALVSLARLPAPAPADIASLSQRIAGARQEARQLAAVLESRHAELRAVAQRAQAAGARERQLSAALAGGRAREARLSRETAIARRRHAVARARLDRSRRLLAGRLVSIYKSDAPDLTTVVLESDGLDDLMTRLRYWEAINRSDQHLAGRLRLLRAEVHRRLVGVRSARDRWRAHNRRVAVARAQIEQVRGRAEAERARLASALASQQAALSALRGRISGWVGEVQRLQRIQVAQARRIVGGWFGDFAIPLSIVMCESGGNYRAVNKRSGAGGAYQILPSTWRHYGGRGRPQDASKAEQDRIAALVWANQGAGAWVCAG